MRGPRTKDSRMKDWRMKDSAGRSLVAASFALHFLVVGLARGEEMDEVTSRRGLGPSTRPPPKFSADQPPQNVTVLAGDTAVLGCMVYNLGSKTVSWVRHRDTHILSSAIFSYTTDSRFAPGSPDKDPFGTWTLSIKNATAEDTGFYECQINTQPPLSRLVALKVIDPVTRILGPGDLYLNEGSMVNLTCTVNYRSGDDLAWFHDGKEVKFDSPRGGITMVTEAGEESTRSSLLLQHVRDSDTGNYSCSTARSPSASVRIHVLQGERQAAMQQGNKSIVIRGSDLITLLLCLLVPVIPAS